MDKRKKLILLSILLLIFPLLSLMGKIYADDTPNVMLIHSYDLSYQWTKKQDQGIRDVLLAEFPKANIYTEVLDAKRFKKDYIFSNQINNFINKYEALKLDTLLATDDIGLEFALAVRDKMAIDIPIVFSGVLQGKAEEYIAGRKKVSGIYEIRSFTRMVELMRLLQPQADKVIVINDTSSSSRQLAKKVINEFTKLNIQNEYEIERWEEKSYSNILNDVSKLDESTAVFLISYHKSFDGVVKTGQIFCKEISEVSTVPMYSLGELYFGAGLTGGEFLSGHLQGEALAEIAIRILKGENADSIPLSSKSTSYLGVDENMTRKYGIDDIELPEDTLLINEEFTFFEQYRTLVIMVLLAFAILITFILTLFIQKRTINKANKTLNNQATEMRALYEQVAASEEMLSSQNEELKFYQEELRFKAEHDFLTGLSNRFKQEKQINDFLEDDIYHKKHLVCAYIDFDDFKYINNSMGHHAGDLVLKEIAQRLSKLKNTYSIARVGGDEFVVFYECNSDNNCTVLIDQINANLKKVFSLPIRIANEMLTISASMGCSVYPNDAKTYDSLIICADLAMYEAKKKNKGKMVRFEAEIEAASDRDFRLGKEIKKGIDTDEFYLVYQPIMKADGSAVNSIEALLRWESSVFGAVSPGEFIHAAEVGGYMLELGNQVIDKAMSFIADNEEVLENIEYVSINISVVQLYEEDFVSELIRKIKDYSVNPRKIQLEIVESMMIHTYDLVYDKLAELRRIGIKIALDDFGTGYSSLAHLNDLPIDTLKIDKRFIDDVKLSSPRNMIIEAIAVLAQSLSLTTIAEGVEEDVQKNYLLNCGIQHIQGYIYSRPLKEKEVLDFINNKS